jgi:AcrR family transcriptional regulator
VNDLTKPAPVGRVTPQMRYKKSEISAAQIVRSAIRVLARQGYARTSLMDIAKEAGMSKGAVHYHYPTKESLIQAVLEAATDTVAQRTLEAWGRGDNAVTSIRSAIQELWRIRAERTEEALVIGDLLAQSQYDEGLRPKLAAYYRYAASQVETHLLPSLTAMGLRPKIPPELLPRVLMGLLDGLVMQHFVDPGALDEAKLVSALESIAGSLFEMG